MEGVEVTGKRVRDMRKKAPLCLRIRTPLSALEPSFSGVEAAEAGRCQAVDFVEVRNSRAARALSSQDVLLLPRSESQCVSVWK